MADTNSEYLGTGRRKTAVARIRLTEGSGQVKINGKAASDFFSHENFSRSALLPFTTIEAKDKFDLVAKVQGGWMEFDRVIATPDMMGQVGKLGKILGPRGLMPNPKTGTVTFDVKQAIEQIQAGKVDYRVDKSGIVHASLGKASFSVEDLAENYQTLIAILVKAKPASSKGHYVRGISVSTTMGVGVRVAYTA